MPSFSWAANESGNWNTGALWTPISVPNTATADVLIDAAATLAAYYTADETETANSFCIKDVSVDYGTIAGPIWFLPVTASSRERPS
jgi:hypothetical protein